MKRKNDVINLHQYDSIRCSSLISLIFFILSVILSSSLVKEKSFASYKVIKKSIYLSSFCFYFFVGFSVCLFVCLLVSVQLSPFYLPTYLCYFQLFLFIWLHILLYLLRYRLIFTFNSHESPEFIDLKAGPPPLCFWFIAVPCAIILISFFQQTEIAIVNALIFCVCDSCKLLRFNSNAVKSRLSSKSIGRNNNPNSSTAWRITFSFFKSEKPVFRWFLQQNSEIAYLGNKLYLQI